MYMFIKNDDDCKAKHLFDFQALFNAKYFVEELQQDC